MKEKKKIYIKISSQDRLYYQGQEIILLSFFKYMNINFQIIPLPRKIKRMMLLKIPHRHKNTSKVFYYFSAFSNGKKKT